MQKQEGEKPHLTLVKNDYAAHVEAVLDTLKQMKADSKPINVREALKHLEEGQDNSRVRDWLVANDVLTKARFEREFQAAQRSKRIVEEIGFVPVNVTDFVERYAEAKGVTLTATGLVERKRSFVFEGEVIDANTAKQSDLHRAAYEIVSGMDNNLNSYLRELRLVNANLKLGFHAKDIDDALSEWAKNKRTAATINMFLSVRFDPKGIARAERMWGIIEDACFDHSAAPKGFATAILKKFIWQVKRKGLNRSVTNHLMPVLTGAQGKGKSTFVNNLCGPACKRDPVSGVIGV
jgi:hypothetical protein